jgi:hypothetical protein
VDDIFRDIGKEQGAVEPERAFRPAEALGKFLDLGVFGHELVERRVEALEVVLEGRGGGCGERKNGKQQKSGDPAHKG